MANANIIDRVFKAHSITNQYLDEFWSKPHPEEKMIIYEFLLSQSFDIFQMPPDILSEFYYELNGIYVNNYGEKEFERYAQKRNKRFHEYLEYFKNVRRTSIYREHKGPISDEESLNMEKYVRLIYQNIDNEIFLTLNEYRDFIDRMVIFIKRSSSLHSAHLFIISDGDLKSYMGLYDTMKNYINKNINNKDGKSTS